MFWGEKSYSNCCFIPELKQSDPGYSQCDIASNIPHNYNRALWMEEDIGSLFGVNDGVRNHQIIL